MQNSAAVTVFHRLCKISKHSAITKHLNKAMKSAGEAFRKSIFAKLFVNGLIGCGEIDDKYEGGSVFYSALQKISTGAFAFGKRIAGMFNKLHEYSISKKIFNKYFSRTWFIKIFELENLLPLLIVIMFIVPHDYWDNMYAMAIALIAAAVYFVSICFGKGAEENPSSIWLSFILFVFAAGAGVLASFDISDSIRVFIFFIISFILCLTVYGTLTDYTRFSKFVMFMYAGLIITSIYAIYQSITGVSADPSLTDLTLNRSMPGRVFSSFGNPNNYAEYLMLFIPFSFVRMLKIKNKGLKLIGLASLLLPVAALALTYSRGCWIAFAIAVVVFVMLYNIKMLYIIILGAILAIPVLPSSIIKRISTIGNMSDTSSSYRFVIWEGALKMLERYWFTGIGLGPGAFKTIYPRYALPRAVTAPHSHMQFMEILIEMGIIGLLSFLWFTICLILKSYRAGRGLQNNNMRCMTIAATAAMAGIGFIGLVEYIWFYPRVMFAFFIAAGMTMAMTKISNKEKDAVT